MTWCERCATGIHFRCANHHAIRHGGDDCIGSYCAKDIAAKSLLCLGCGATRRPYVNEAMKVRWNEATNRTGTRTGAGGAGLAA